MQTVPALGVKEDNMQTAPALGVEEDNMQTTPALCVGKSNKQNAITSSVKGESEQTDAEKQGIVKVLKKVAPFSRAISVILLVMYLSLLIFLTLFSRGYMRNSFFRSMNLVPFRTIFLYLNANINNNIIVTNLLGNIVAFMPLGFLLPLIWEKTSRFIRILIASLGASLAIEAMQYLMAAGAADVDDLILNTAGGMLGYFILVICRLICRKIFRTQRQEKKV